MPGGGHNFAGIPFIALRGAHLDRNLQANTEQGQDMLKLTVLVCRLQQSTQRVTQTTHAEDSGSFLLASAKWPFVNCKLISSPLECMSPSSSHQEHTEAESMCLLVSLHRETQRALIGVAYMGPLTSTVSLDPFLDSST